MIASLQLPSNQGLKGLEECEIVGIVRLAISMSLLVKVSTWLFDWSMMSVIWVEHKLEKKDQSARLKFQVLGKITGRGCGGGNEDGKVVATTV